MNRGSDERLARMDIDRFSWSVPKRRGRSDGCFWQEVRVRELLMVFATFMAIVNAMAVFGFALFYSILASIIWLDGKMFPT